MREANVGLSGITRAPAALEGIPSVKLIAESHGEEAVLAPLLLP